MGVLSTHKLIQDFGERTGERCGCCGKFTLFSIKYDDAAATVAKLCSICDVERSLKSA